MSALVIDNIGLLVTNDPELGEGPLGHRAATRRSSSRTAGWQRSSRAGVAGDDALRRRRPLRDPGLRRQPHPPRLRRRPLDEFAARMAGAPYEAGGIRVTTEATRAASARRAASASPARASPRRWRAGITHIEIKSGYGLDVEPERRLCEVAARAHRRRHVPRRPRRATRVRGPRRRLRRAGLRRDARRVRPALPLDRRLLRARRLRRRAVAGRARGGPRRRPRPARARQPARPGPGRRGSRSRWAPPRSTTAPISPTPTSRRSPASDTVATFLPATDFSTRQPYPDARRVIDAGANVAIATNRNPGSSYTTLDVVLHRARGARHGDDRSTRRCSRRPLGGARALRRDDLGRLGPGRPRRRGGARRALATRTSSTARACR